jgi:hypothetical protein
MLVEYAGTGNMWLAGNSSANFVLYAPNGNVTLTGNDNFYGAIIGAKISETGSASVHYDGALKNYIVKLGNYQVVSWNRIVN